jgi:Fe-S-cluster-containing dehydrogenase component
MSHYCIVINVDRCSGCFGCEIACKMENSVALGQRWSKVLTVGPIGEYPDMTRYAMPSMCQQCQNAPCVNVCPTGASYRDSTTDIVLINKEKCIGCKYCMMACPYGVRSWNSSEKCIEKCTLCGQLTSAGKLPACVKSCATGARFYGDLDDPDSDVSRELARYDASDIHTLENVGNNPSTKYIMTDMIGEWQERVVPRSAPQTVAYPVEDE